MVEPPHCGTLAPTHLVILSGLEVGIFTEWYVIYTSYRRLFRLLARLTCRTNSPPFRNSFHKWSEALTYYTDEFVNGNVRILYPVQGCTLNPIYIPSNAPTPVKSVSKGKRVSKRKNRETSPTPGQPQAGSSRARADTRILKQARVSFYNHLFSEEELAAALPGFGGRVINVSDFSTP